MSEPRVLIVRFRAIGDCVMSAWATSALRRRNPNSTIWWAIEPECNAVIERTNLVNRVVEFPRRDWQKARWNPRTWNETIRTYLSLRQGNFTHAFDLQGHTKTTLAAKISGAKICVGLDPKDAISKRLAPGFIGFDRNRHWVENMHACISSRLPVDVLQPPLMPEGTQNSSDFNNLVTINVGASIPEKLIASTIWLDLTDLLVSSGYSVAFIGGPADEPVHHPQALDLVGKCTLDETVFILRHSAAHFCGDTGTGHIASAVRTPTVSVFVSGRNHPRNYQPFGEFGTYFDGFSDPETLNAERIFTQFQEKFGH